ncbi:stAR-related lipid transfer protein 7, mitochondrial-like [Oppia nitens]|uniref:stAR-related lipid transfer protein 7, mitochondrial-like n=1 Tax=Oppia nitens TaxID=1686743 RepID=UPI0023DC06FB|nr:stAR-related lipid transfer protein 7, mitochondrial-like [Oppia nitens]
MLLTTTNQLLISQLRSQSLTRQRIQLLNNRPIYGYQVFSRQHWSTTITNSGHFWNSFRDTLYERVDIFVRLLRQQSNVYMSLRLRRMAQICGLYNRIYSESTVHKMMSQMLIRLRIRALSTLRCRLNNYKSNDSVKYLMSAVCGLFCWDNQRITDFDLKQTINDFECIQKNELKSFANKFSHDLNKDNCGKSNTFSVSAETSEDKESDGQWEPVIMRDNFKLWRRSYPNTSLYQYKVYGTFDDIPARTFFRVQMDTEYRKKWDKLVIKLDIVDKESFIKDKDHMNNEDSGNEVLHWIMKYPYPMSTRDYVYLRRSRVDVKNNVMVLMSKSIEYPKLPETSQHVRVVNYSSQMVIKPHTTFDECGFDYLLTYFDDPRAAFPMPAYNWMAVSGVPEFVNKLHSAAFQLFQSNNYKSNKYQKQNCFNTTTHSTELYA